MILKDADSRVDDMRALKKLRLSCVLQERTRIDNEIRNIHTGMEGERSVAHYLARDFAHDEDIAILHDIRMAYQSDHAQMDHLIIDRITGVIWVLETKNYNGKLICNTHGDWSVEYARSTLPIESPVSQARRHCTTLLLWLRQHSIPITDVRPIVLVGPKTALDRQGYTDNVPLMKSDNFPEWVKTERRAVIEQGSVAMSVLDFKQLGRLICDAHEPKRQTDWQRALRLSIIPPQQQVKMKASQRGSGRKTSTSSGRTIPGFVFAIGVVLFGAYKILTGHPNSEMTSPVKQAVIMPGTKSGRTTDTGENKSTSPFRQIPVSGTVEWGIDGQPISGALARVDIWDVTQSPQNKIVRIRRAMVAKANGINSSVPIATIYMDAGARVTLNVRPGVYDVVATSGEIWDPETRRFKSGSTTVSFPSIMPTQDAPGIIAMGAADQAADIVEDDRF